MVPVINTCDMKNLVGKSLVTVHVRIYTCMVLVTIEYVRPGKLLVRRRVHGATDTCIRQPHAMTCRKVSWQVPRMRAA